MPTPAAIPWVQFDERVVGENHPTFTDVDNRALKFIVTQSDFSTTGLFPGFLVRTILTASPEGSLVGNIGESAIDTVAQRFYLKLANSGANTGWVGIGGNQSGNGSPEGVITAVVGQLYEQRDAATNANIIWVKRSGTGNTGWIQTTGLVKATDNAIIITGTTGTFTATVTNSIGIGNGFTIAAAGVVAVGKSASVSAADGVAIGNAATVTSAATGTGIAIGTGSVNGVSGISIGTAATAGTLSNWIAIGHSHTYANTTRLVAGTIAIGSVITLTGPNAGTPAGATIAIGRTINIGDGAGGTTQNNIVIGTDIQATGGSTSNCIIIGNTISWTGAASGSIGIGASNVVGNTNVAIGQACAITAGSSSVVVGASATNSQTNAVVVGSNATNSGTSAVVIGQTAGNTANSVTAVGFGVSVTHANTITIGTSISSFVAKSVFIGHGNGVTVFLVGKGDVSASPEGLSFRLSNGSGTNIAAGDLTLIPGLATGNAVSGSIIFQTGTVGASGATVQTAATRLTVATAAITATVIVITPATAAASAGLRLPHGTLPTTPVDGDMWTTTAGLFVRINGVTKTVTLT